jgi:glycosyltransferase involved in cell wall biosynthesis
VPDVKVSRPATRVLFLQSQTYFGADTGIHSQLMRHMSRDEVEVHVACNPRNDANVPMTAYPRICAIPDIHVRPTEFGPSLDSRSAVERGWQIATRAPLLPAHLIGLGAYAKRHGINVIHGTEKPRDALYGVMLARAIGAKSVVHLHVEYADWLRPMVRWAIRNADAVVGVSDFVSRTLVAGGIDANRVYTVVNGLETRGGTWEPRSDADEVRREFGLSPDTVLIGTVSRLFPSKGTRALLEAVAAILPVAPHVHLMIVGEDDPRATPGGGSFTAELKAFVQEKQIAGNVTFTGFRRDIPRLMNAFDIFSMPSLKEPLGMVYLEAMSLGKPVAAYRSGGVPEIVDHGVTGTLTTPHAIGELADALRTMVLDRNLREAMGRAGRAKVARECNETTMSASMQSVYRSLATGRRETPVVSVVPGSSVE